MGKVSRGSKDCVKPEQFERISEAGARAPGREAGHSPGDVAGRLNRELEAARRESQRDREKFEAAVKELRAANEELKAANEEYRSAAGALEARHEELQSVNEELLRVNAELKARLEGASRANSDLRTEEALKASEARLRLLLSELSHRVKNTLAVVQSLARQSFRGNVSREEGLEAFSNRLRAFAEAHNLLVSSDWRGAGLRELAERQLDPYARAGDKEIAVNGPPVSLPPDVATPFALVLHELATNALKYGALSTPAGALQLEWGIADAGPDGEFQFTWRESGGPKVKPPSNEGFGSWLIQNGLPDAKVALEYPEGGVVCTITMPATKLRSE